MDTPRSSMAVRVWSSQLDGPRLAMILVERKLKRRSQISCGVMCSDCRHRGSVRHSVSAPTNHGTGRTGGPVPTT